MNLHQVDDSFQKHNEDIDKVKLKTEEIIKANAKRMNVMKNWKNDIRDNIMKVRNEFVSWVDSFTN